MNRIAVFFRGRNTDNIIHDAVLRFGVVRPDDQIIVVCRNNDAMSKNTDVKIEDVSISTFKNADKIVIVANGGTTEQVVPIIEMLAYEAGREVALYGHNSRPYEIYDVQRDNVKILSPN